ncbi:MAG: hypothetical protein Q6354_08865, partial [Candidatus Brocadiales bacterium]|nr:hypothetical protein [Candidatus Brocadiales bacterium]
MGEVEAWDSPEALARRYLAHYLTAPPAPFHKELYSLMTSRESNKREAIAAPRGHGKSVLMSLVFPLWALATGRKRFILIISSTSNIAEGFLASIIRELEENPLLRRDFGDLVGREKWTDREILTSTEIRVCAKGTNSGLRGMRSFQSRPDLIICDDIEDDESVQSSEQRKKLESWFYGSVLNLPGPQGDAFIIGTVLHHDSLLGKLLRKWKGLRYQALSQDGSVLWPDYYDRERLEKIRQGDGEKEGIGTIAFQCEYQNNPISPDEQLIREEWVRYYRREDIEGQELLIVTALDPALGGGSGGDFSALVTVGYSPKADGRIYVLEADIARRTPKATLESAIRNFKRWSFSDNVGQTFRSAKTDRGISPDLSGADGSACHSEPPQAAKNPNRCREGVYPLPITEGYKGPPYERRDVASEQSRDRSLDLSEDVAGGMGASPLSPSPLSPEDDPGAAHR